MSQNTQYQQQQQEEEQLLKQKEKKSHTALKAKIITALILIVALMAVGFYLGYKFQRQFNLFMFTYGQSMITYSIWAVIILVVLLVCYVAYLIFKVKHNKNQRQQHSAK